MCARIAVIVFLLRKKLSGKKVIPSILKEIKLRLDFKCLLYLRNM